MEWLKWLEDNQQWFFSGAGIFIVSSIVGFLSVIATVLIQRRRESELDVERPFANEFRIERERARCPELLTELGELLGGLDDCGLHKRVGNDKAYRIISRVTAVARSPCRHY